MSTNLDELRVKVSSEGYIKCLEIVDGLISKGYIDKELKDRAMIRFLKDRIKQESGLL